MKKESKRYKNLLKSVVKDKKLNSKEILELVKKNSNTKFDESVDVSLRINLKQSKGGDFNLRTTVKLPNGSGKKEKIAVLCEPDKLGDAKNSGAEVYGSDDLIEKEDAKLGEKSNSDSKDIKTKNIEKLESKIKGNTKSESLEENKEDTKLEDKSEQKE